MLCSETWSFKLVKPKEVWMLGKMNYNVSFWSGVNVHESRLHCGTASFPQNQEVQETITTRRRILNQLCINLLWPTPTQRKHSVLGRESIMKPKKGQK